MAPRTPATQRIPLTPRQQEYFEFIRQFVSDHGRAPTVTQLAREFATSRGNASIRVSQIIARGWLRREPGFRHSLQLVEAAL